MTNIYNAIQNLYNMDKTSWQEVLAELYNLVSDTNGKFEVFESKFGEKLGEKVTLEIKKYYDDGLLSKLINDVLLKDINTKVDNFKSEINEQLDNIENKTKPYNIDKEVVFGQEYLSAWHKKIINKELTNVTFSGDSTTAGDGTTSPYKVHEIFSSLCVNSGIEINCVNNGFSGRSSEDWSMDGGTLAYHDIPSNPDLIILRWGLNDSNTANDTTKFEYYMDLGLQKLRIFKPLSELSIVLMSSNNVNSTQYPEKNLNWGKKTNDILRRLARKYKCCFIDTFAIWSEPNTEWLDKYNIHPLNVANTWIISRLFEVIAPISIRENQLINDSTNGNELQMNTLPNLYPNGISIYKYNNGNAITFKSKTDTVFQILTDKNLGYTKIRVGRLTDNLWLNEYTIKGKTSNVNLSLNSGWVNFENGFQEAQVYKDGDTVHLKGLIKNGTITQNEKVFLCSLPVGFIPSKSRIFNTISYNGTETVNGTVWVESDGIVSIYSGGNSWFSLEGIFFDV